MLDKYAFKQLATKIAEEFISNGTPLKVSIKKVVIEGDLNPEQIKRLTEASNVETYNRLYDAEEEKTFKFDIANPKEILAELHSEPIQDMMPVQYKDDEKQGPTHMGANEYLGDEDEAEASKMDIPKKDYKEQTAPPKVVEKDKEETRGDKEAQVSNPMDKLAEIHSDLKKRIQIQSDTLIDEFTKVASLFNTPRTRERFDEFQKNAKCLYKEYSHLDSVLNELSKFAHVSYDTKAPASLFASEQDYGIQKFARLIELHKTYVDTMNTLKFVEGQKK